MHLKIVTMEQTLWDEEILSIQAESPTGQFVILSHHAPLIAMTIPSPTVLTLADRQKKILYTGDGILRVLNNEVIFITDQAEWKEALDAPGIRAQLATVERELTSPGAPTHLKEEKIRLTAQLKTALLPE